MTSSSRRGFLRDAGLGFGALAVPWLPAWAQPVSAGLMPTLTGTDIALTVDHVMATIDGRPTHAIGVNGTLPAPLLRLREGQRVRLTVTNRLAEETSIH